MLANEKKPLSVCAEGLWQAREDDLGDFVQGAVGKQLVAQAGFSNARTIGNPSTKQAIASPSATCPALIKKMGRLNEPEMTKVSSSPMTMLLTKTGIKADKKGRPLMRTPRS